MRRLPPLPALRAFEAAARHMSFKRAAAELAVTPTAISHQVRLLEDTLGMRLFERHPRRLLLTGPGLALFPVLRDGLDAVAAAIAAITAKPARPALTLSATPAFAARWLVPRMGSFSAANPQIDLRLHASEEPVELRSGGIDAAIRYGSGRFPGLKAEPLLRDTFAVVCSPHLGVRTPADLRRHTLIHFEWQLVTARTPTWLRWWAAARLAPPRQQPSLTFSDESHAIQAAIAGQGVALLSLLLVADELGSGALVQPFGPHLDNGGCFLVYRPADEGKAGIAALRAWLLREAAAARGGADRPAASRASRPGGSIPASRRGAAAAPSAR